MGPYDNQNFIFLETPAVMEGHWYRGPSGELYVIPNDLYGAMDAIGPDDVVEDELVKFYNAHLFDDVDVNLVEERFGLSFIQPWQRRFEERIGHYHV